MQSEVIDLSQSTYWQEILDSLAPSLQDIYFSPDYYQLASENNEGDVRCFIFRDREKVALYPFLINSINKLNIAKLDDEYFDIQGAYGYNGVLTNSMSSDFKRTFYQHFDSYCRLNNIVAEFTRFHPILQNHEFSRDNMEILYNRATCCVDLRPEYENIWKSAYNSNNRNMIRRAIKAGVRCETESTDIETFHSLYSKTMSHVNAEDFYFFSMNYFSKLSALDGFRQVRVDLGGRQVASLILLVYGKYAHYHLAGRDIYQAPPGVANLVLDEAVKCAKDMGCETLHLGGGSGSFENDGLYRFKTGFSKLKTDFFIGKKIHNYSIYNQLCESWEKTHPHKKKKFNGLLLKYRKTA